MEPRTAVDPRSAVEDLGRYVMESPSSFHAAHAAAARLEEAGFVRLDETEDWARTGVRGRRYVLRDGAVIAWATPAEVPPAAGFRILGAHTDSPGFKLKPRPTTTAHTWHQAGVETYGGALLNSWLDRELRLAGRLVVRGTDGAPVEHLTATGPVARIPQLAIHLDREANKGGGPAARPPAARAADLPRIELRFLQDHGEDQSFLLRLEPGASLPAHHHHQDEDCVVLQGSVRLGDIEAGTGTFHLALDGSDHGVVSAATSCVLYLRTSLDRALL